jgi:CheY-like chemotaxis protein
LKHAATLSAIPVAVITSSDVPNDRELALAAGACAFLPKPQGLEAMTQMLVNLRDACARTTQSATTIA